MMKTSFIVKTYVVFTHLESPNRGNSNVYLQHMLLKKGRKLFGNLHFPSIISIVFTSFKHPKLPISIRIPVTLHLHGCSISKFEFMNYLFASLQVAWLYIKATILANQH